MTPFRITCVMKTSHETFRKIFPSFCAFSKHPAKGGIQRLPLVQV